MSAEHTAHQNTLYFCITTNPPAKHPLAADRASLKDALRDHPLPSLWQPAECHRYPVLDSLCVLVSIEEGGVFVLDEDQRIFAHRISLAPLLGALLQSM